jgi:tetratricopeptide (TPR) repeat protein
MATENKARILRDAEKFVLQGKIPQAIAEYQRILKFEPDDVLTLNTVGDLYLRLGNVPEATRLFILVAESYTRNNFLLKAIAVYKKILKVDPRNIDVELTLAELYAKQGLTADARNQFIRVADLHEREGRRREMIEILERVVVLEPHNSQIQCRLAEIYLADGLRDKAHQSLLAAARAQTKVGDLKAAARSFERALELNPDDFGALKGFVEASMEIGDVSRVQAELRRALLSAPGDAELLEMLGKAQIVGRDADSAAVTFRTLLEVDESRYRNVLDVAGLYLELERYDDAAASLEPVLPILIGRRETGRAIDVCNRILQHNADHEPTLRKLEEIFSAINDLNRYAEVLERLLTTYMNRGDLPAALACLDKLIPIRPENESHLKLHRKIFSEVCPDATYRSPLDTPASRFPARAAEVSIGTGFADAAAKESEEEASLVEIDLLITYGMVDKARALLDHLIARDPEDKEARARLVSLCRDIGDSRRAAEESLLLAACYLKAGNLEQADRCVGDARRLAPNLVGVGFDLAAFGRKHGLEVTEPGAITTADARSTVAAAPLEVDLSGDLTDIFFGAESDPAQVEETAARDGELEAEGEESVEEIPVRKPAEPVSDQLQEVDFYIRLGFLDEARAKLDEIAKTHPDHPEVPLRYQQLRQQVPAAEAAPLVIAAPSGPPGQAEETLEFGDVQRLFQDLEPEAAGFSLVSESQSAPTQVAPTAAEETPIPGGNPAENRTPPVEPSEPTRIHPAAPAEPVNAMFADLIEEVNALNQQKPWKEDFEVHFNLGIAYREMGLTDDAIREFEDAARLIEVQSAPREMIQCCGMLSTCFRAKNMLSSVIRWCQMGLNVHGIGKAESMALRYDMALAYLSTGENERAFEALGAIFAVDPTYRDVAQRIDNLRHGTPGIVS